MKRRDDGFLGMIGVTECVVAIGDPFREDGGDAYYEAINAEMESGCYLLGREDLPDGRECGAYVIVPIPDAESGYFPVYADYTADGHVASATVVFIPGGRLPRHRG